MLIIKPWNIEAYTKCPKRAYFSWNTLFKKNANLEVITRAIKKTYSTHAKRQLPLSWRAVSQFTTSAINEQVAAIEKGTSYGAPSNSITKMGTWHERYYKNAYCYEGLVNFPIYLGIDNSHVFKDTIDVVTIENGVRLYDFKEIPNLATLLAKEAHSDIITLSRIWGFYQHTQMVPVEYIRFTVTKKTLKAVVIKVDQKLLDKATRIVGQLLQNIRHDVFYPSESKDCAECPYLNKCYL